MALDRRRIPARPLLVFAIALAGLAGAFAPTTADAASSYSQNLYRPGDFVRQYQLYVSTDGGIFWRSLEPELPDIEAVAWID